MLALFSLLLIGVVLGDPCDFGTSPLVMREDIEECFKQQPWDKTLKDSIYDNLDKYLDMSQFTEQLLSPPSPFESLKIDQKEELKKLKDKSDSYQYEYQAHHDLIAFYKKAFDPHQVYIAPRCFTSFQRWLPFVPSMTMGVDGFTVVKLVDLSASMSSVYERFLSNPKYAENYPTAETINHYIGMEIVKINDKEPIEFFKEVGRYTGRSKEVGSMINAVDRYYLGSSSGSQGFFQYDELVYTFIEGGVEVNITVPFIYEYLTGITSSDQFRQYCNTGTVASHDRELEEVLETMRTQDKHFQIDNTPLLRRLFKRLGIKPEEQPKESVSEISSGYEKTPIAADEAAGYTIDLYKVGSENIGVWVLGTFSMTDPQITAMYNGLVKLRDIGINKLLVDVRGNGGGYVYLASLCLHWLNKDAGAYTQLYWKKRRNEVSDAVFKGIDSGGCADVLTHEPIPVQQIISTETILHFEDIDDKNQHFSHPVSYTDKFTIDVFSYVEDGEVKYADEYPYFNTLFSLDREDVIILGDGIGGSATGMFMWGAKQFMLGRLVSVGGFKGRTESYPAGFASFTGASVMESDDIVYYGTLAENKELFPTPMPHGSGVRVTWYSVMSYDNQGTLQEFRPSTGDAHIYYYSGAGVSSKPNFSADYPALLDKALEIWNAHSYSGALWPQVAKRTNVPCSYTDATSVYGHLWDEASHSYTGPCTFLHCSKLYYYDYSEGACKPIPEVTGTKPAGDDGGMTTEAIVFLALMLVFLVVAIAFAVLFFLGKKKTMGKAPTGAVMIDGVSEAS